MQVSGRILIWTYRVYTFTGHPRTRNSRPIRLALVFVSASPRRLNTRASYLRAGPQTLSCQFGPLSARSSALARRVLIRPRRSLTSPQPCVALGTADGGHWLGSCPGAGGPNRQKKNNGRE